LSKITTIGFDADDTLWHNETHYHATQKKFLDLLGGESEELCKTLTATKIKNLKNYGFGIKGTTLSMIETAISAGASSDTVAKILDIGREMLAHPVELFPHVHETLGDLQRDFRLLLITKGDIFEQERKVAASGLIDYFHGIEIVSDKNSETYDRIFKRHGSAAAHGLMIGNSLKSDVIPMLNAGGHGVHVPFELTWEYEREAAPEDHPRFHVVKDLSQIAELINRL
jgi:putative hydrolase of the HAD superfamily